MLTLTDILRRDPAPQPWSEFGKIPWEVPEFSERMLAEHLSQAHDAASRRTDRVRQHVRWIHDAVLHGDPSRVLDLGCGPGLYTSALSQLGHDCVGIDFSPASVAHARGVAARYREAVQYIQGDIRAVEFGVGFDLVMLIFGEFNVFSRGDALAILTKARGALSPKGQVLLEVHTFEAVRTAGLAPATWSSRERGIFSAKPHLLLEESAWHEEGLVASRRYFVIDADTAGVARYGQCVQAYESDGYSELLRESGFPGCTTFPSLGEQDDNPDFIVLLAEPY